MAEEEELRREQAVLARAEEQVRLLDLAGDLAQKITMLNVDNDVRFLEDYAIAELPVPGSFVGNTIKKVRIE